MYNFFGDRSLFDESTTGRGVRVKDYWLLGMIQDGNEDFRQEFRPNNGMSAKALIPLKRRHVALNERSSWGRMPHSLRVVTRTKRWTTLIHEGGWRLHTAHQIHVKTDALVFPLTSRAQDRFADHVVEYQRRRHCSKAGLDKFDEVQWTINGTPKESVQYGSST